MKFPADVDVSNKMKHWSRDEIIDLVGFYEVLGPYDIALMLSRTYKSVCAKYCELKKRNKIEFYMQLFLKGDYYN